jgi:hypothetical protein
MVTQKVLLGLGMVNVPHKNTISGSGNDKNVADLIWFRNMMK